MSTNHPTGIRSLTETTETTRDPVCKTEIEVDVAAPQASYAGRTYHFCSDECADLFRSSPESYVPRIAQA